MTELNYASKTVLVADDDLPINELVRLVLETRGYRVVSVVDGDDALAAVKRENPALIVLDVMMPKTSGLEVCHFVKTDPRYKDIKVVMLSAKGLDVDKLRAKGSGADAYLVKPVRLADLLDTVNGLLFPPDPA